MNRRIRVLHLLTSLGPGGAETNLLALLQHFDLKQYDHAIAYGGGGVLTPQYQTQQVRLLSLAEKSLSLRLMYKLPAMIKQIQAYAPDILHAHLDIPNAFALLMRPVLGCKLVLHLHGQGIVPRSEMPKRGAWQLLWNAIAHFYKYCDYAIAICRFQLPYLKRLGFRDDQVVVIPNGINLTGFPRTSGPARDNYRFVHVARFFQEKRHDLLIEAFKEVNRGMPHTHLTLVGDGPLRSGIESKVRALGLQGKVEILGVRRDVPEILAKSDCFVLNSHWELHPITILEAMRAGLPVIATAVGGVPDTVENQVTGLVVPPDNMETLVHAMLEMAQNPQRARQMGEQGYRAVTENFSNTAVARKIEKMYTQLLHRSAYEIN